MKTKQQAIQEAYGEYWETVNEYVNSQGWCNAYWNLFENLNGITKPKSEGTLWRPKSLQGMENNNGWIKIESEEDLPKEIEGLWEVVMNGKQTFIELLKDNRERLFIDFKKDRITHYKIVPKSKPPIY